MTLNRTAWQTLPGGMMVMTSKWPPLPSPPGDENNVLWLPEPEVESGEIECCGVGGIKINFRPGERESRKLHFRLGQGGEGAASLPFLSWKLTILTGQLVTSHLSSLHNIRNICHRPGWGGDILFSKFFLSSNCWSSVESLMINIQSFWCKTQSGSFGRLVLYRQYRQYQSPLSSP